MTPHLLLVDDEAEFVATLSERLELRGFSTRTRRDGESALSLVETERFDAVVLDLLMPGMNGLETLKEIRIRNPDLPVILLTGHGSTREGMTGMRLGAADYLIKPVSIEELVGKLHDILGA